jgi:hypothetical protein
MPSRKLFEAFDINAMFNGGNTVKMLSMREISDIYFGHIKTTYQYLGEGKTVSIEVPNHDKMYQLRKLDNGNFEFTDLHEKNEWLPIDLVNWLFKTAPFISLVGYENS